MRQLESEEMDDRHSVELQWHQQLVEDVVRSQHEVVRLHTMEREGQRRHQDALSKACVLFVCLFVCLFVYVPVHSCVCGRKPALSDQICKHASEVCKRAASKAHFVPRYKPVPRADAMMCTYAVSGGVYAMLEMAPLLRFTG